MRLLLSLVLLTSIAAPVAAHATDLSTGVASYTVVTPASATAPAIDVANPNVAWTANIPGASWINASGSGTASDPSGIYYYYTLFSTTGVTSLSGSFAADNDASVYVVLQTATTLNTALASDAYGPPYGFQPGGVTSFNDNNLAAGNYALVFEVTNGDLAAGGSDGNGPTGLLAGVTLASVKSISAATPEPSSLVLLGTGIMGLAGALRRKMRS